MLTPGSRIATMGWNIFEGVHMLWLVLIGDLSWELLAFFFTFVQLLFFIGLEGQIISTCFHFCMIVKVQTYVHNIKVLNLTLIMESDQITIVFWCHHPFKAALCRVTKPKSYDLSWRGLQYISKVKTSFFVYGKKADKISKFNLELLLNSNDSVRYYKTAYEF